MSLDIFLSLSCIKYYYKRKGGDAHMHDVRDMQLLQEVLAQYDDLVNRPLLHDLSCLCVTPPLPCSEPIYLLHIKTLPENSNSSYFIFILNALASLSHALGYFLCSNNGELSIYVGIKGKCSAAFSLLQSGLLQTFPGTTFEVVLDVSRFLTNFFSPSNCLGIASATVIPNTSFTPPLLTQFINLMGNSSNYAAFFLVHPISRRDLLNYYDELCEIYNTLSIFNQVNFNHTHGFSKNGSTTITNGKTTTDGTSTTETNGNNVVCGENFHTCATISTGAPCVYLNNNNINLSFLSNKACNHSHTDNFSCAQASNCNIAHSRTDSRLSGENKTDNHGITYSAQNICVQNALSTLSPIINRIQLLLQSTIFEYGAYFLSTSSETSIRAAYSFIGLAPDTSKYLGPSLVNFWLPEHPSYSLILEALCKFENPQFYSSNINHSFHNTTLIQSIELFNSVYFPM